MKKKKSRNYKKTIYISLCVFLSFLLFYAGVYIYASLQPKLAIDSANGFYLYDSKGSLIGGGNENWVSLDKISPYLVDATIAVEDKNFYNHKGFDFLRIGKAMMNNIKSRSTSEGASTITQQYAKNLFLDFDKTWTRKLNEAWLTVRLESHYSKDEILEGYLNTINYGGVYGIEDASNYYFGKHSKDLSLAEASILAGIPKSPSNYSPIQNEKAAKTRQALILNAMVKNDYITEKEKESALREELVYVGNTKSKNISASMYYKDAVLSELKTLTSIPSSFLSTGGLKIYTTLDQEAQQILEDSMEKNIKEESEIEISAMMMDSNSGAVLAILGGRNYAKSQYNRVTSSKRQVGSTMKPFLYYTALENGFTASTTFTSEKTTFTFSGDKTYAPENYANLYANKNISLAAAIAYSDNIYAVKTHLFLGEETLVEFAARLGISNNLEAVPSLALGTNEINITDMMRGYGSFSSGGEKVVPHYITKVEDIHGNLLYEFKQEKETILNKSTVYLLNELLTNCYNKNFIDYNYPTCSSIASKITKKYAIKTGTTDTDNWIFGYNHDVLLGTWLGYDDNRETNNEDSLAMKNFWVDSMEGYLKDKADNWYETPSNVIGVLANPITGDAASENTKNASLFYYIKGTQPDANESTMEEAISAMKQQ